VRGGGGVRLEIALVAVLAGGCASGKDVVPETRDVHADTTAGGGPGAGAGAGGGAGAGTAGSGGAAGGYDYVARRPRAIVALAEGRGLSREVAVMATDRVADQMETCSEDLLHKGQLVRGAARVVVKIAPDGTLSGMAVKTSPGTAVAANAILCFIAPVKALTFPPESAAAPDRGIAFEATWDPG
jgi:hypothetical protein